MKLLRLFRITSFLIITFAVIAIFPNSGSAATGSSRGYVTTPGELAVIARKAAAGSRPYANAVLSVKSFANSGSAAVQFTHPVPTFWPYGTASGPQVCISNITPLFLTKGAGLVEAKAMVYGLLLSTDPALANQYAADVRTEILQLATTTSYGDPLLPGKNQCVLNLSWSAPSWVIAADLIQSYPGWSLSDKATFQHWLARQVYPKVSWASDVRSNNWGSAGSAAAGIITDYLAGSGILLVEQDGTLISAHNAYIRAKTRQLDRMDGNSYMDNFNCHEPGVGFRPDGGIPEELARGTTGCNGLWVLQQDKSWLYMMTHLQGTLLQAELLLRRGDSSIYSNTKTTGAGSAHRAILFLLHNPNNPAESPGWNLGNDCSALEVAYRHYRDAYMGDVLGASSGIRRVCTESGQLLHFGTLTHGFARGENPGLPPITSAP